MVDNIKISEKDIKKVADNDRFQYIRTSAKMVNNISDNFLYIAKIFWNLFKL